MALTERLSDRQDSQLKIPYNIYYKIEIEKLPYMINDLEPIIPTGRMQLHFDKYHECIRNLEVVYKKADEIIKAGEPTVELMASLDFGNKTAGSVKRFMFLLHEQFVKTG